jgi:alkanesulfonate monooxygenase SsuD/methylene tetrahydromethanopterin reductase-like flavin-dependent oxidoreductase (luciferase family)
MTTKYAIYLPNYGAFGDARVLADLAREAENAGWDGFFLWDHIANHNQAINQSENMVDPWIALAAIVMQTSTIRIGTTVTPLPRRRPWKLARETVSIDRLSKGRMAFGVGIGGGEGEWHHLGEESDLQVRGKMLDEGLDVLTGLWSAEPFSYEGEHYRVKNAHFLPGPVQTPRIPVWVGGFWPNKAPFRRMARWDGMFPLFDVYGPERDLLFAESVAFVKAEREAAGIDGPFDVIMVGDTPGDNPDQAAAWVRPAVDAGATWWLEILYPQVFGFDSGTDAAFAAMRGRVLQGPPRI